jgi:hypothetical protein
MSEYSQALQEVAKQDIDKIVQRLEDFSIDVLLQLW